MERKISTMREWKEGIDRRGWFYLGIRMRGIVEILGSVTDPVISFTDFLVNMSASADVLAQAKVEIALGAIPEGKNVRVFLLPYTSGSCL